MKQLFFFLCFLTTILSTQKVSAQCNATLSFGEIEVLANGNYAVDVLLTETALFVQLDIMVAFDAPGVSLTVLDSESTGRPGIGILPVANNPKRAILSGGVTTPLVNGYLGTIVFEMPFGACLSGITFITSSYLYQSSGGCGPLDIEVIDRITQYCSPDRTIYGLIESPIFGNLISGVDIAVKHSPTQPQLQFLNQMAHYEIDVPTSSLEVTATKEGDWRCGISAPDLTKIHAHLLGTQLFSHFSEYVAADLDGNKRITTIDLVRIRKIILGYPAMENLHKNWDLIPTDIYASIPLPPQYTNIPGYSSIRNVGAGSEDVYGVGFTAIKIGDVTDNCLGARIGDFDDNGSSGGRGVGIPERSTTASLVLPDVSLKEGETIMLPVYMSDFVDKTLLSLSFEAEGSHLSILDVLPGALPYLDETAFHINRSNDQLALIWFPYDHVPRSIAQDQPLFYLSLRAETQIDAIGKVLHLGASDSQFLVHADGSEAGIVLKTEGDASSTAISTLHVYPNPFTESYVLGFDMDKSQTVQCRLYDSSGNLVHSSIYKTVKGYNALPMAGFKGLMPGVYIQMVITDTGITSTKIVKK